MFSQTLKALILVLVSVSAKAASYCTDFSGTYQRTVKGTNQQLQIVQTACDLIQSSQSLSTVAPQVRQLFLNNVPSLNAGQTISGRMVGSWLQIQLMNFKSGQLNSTVVETLALDDATKNRLMIRVQTFNSMGIQTGTEEDSDFIRLK